MLVVDVRRETDDAITLVLHPEDGRPIPFRAGQYLTHCFDVDGPVSYTHLTLPTIYSV